MAASHLFNPIPSSARWKKLPHGPGTVGRKRHSSRALPVSLPSSARRKTQPVYCSAASLPLPIANKPQASPWQAGLPPPPALVAGGTPTSWLTASHSQRPDVRKDHAERCFTILPLITETTRVRPLLLASILYKHPMARNRELCCRRLCLVMPAGHSIPMSCFQEAITYKMSTSTTGRAPICFQGAWPCCMYFLHILPSPCIPPLGGTFKESPGMLCLEQNCSNSAPAQMCSSMCTGGRG